MRRTQNIRGKKEKLQPSEGRRWDKQSVDTFVSSMRSTGRGMRGCHRRAEKTGEAEKGPSNWAAFTSKKM